MKALFIGLGSIGIRHLKNLKRIQDAEIIAYNSGCKHKSSDIRDMFNVLSFESMAEAIGSKPDFAIISNPTNLHVKTAFQLADSGIPFLIEKPVSDSQAKLDRLSQLVKEKKLPVMVGFQLRCHPGYKQLRKIVQAGEIGRPLSLQGYVGQYLPTWHPHEDYRANYSAKKDQGGGVILDLCHELDIATSILGPAISLNCYQGHCSDLEIETEDIAEITMAHEKNVFSHIHLNYLEPGYKWVTSVLGTRGKVTWDYGNRVVTLAKLDGTYEQWDDPVGYNRGHLFQDQLSHWLAVIKDEKEPIVDLDTGIMITRLCDAAKRSSIQRIQVEIKNV